VSNIGNFLTTLNLMVMFIFVEFNLLNKYVRSCKQLYIIKYVDQ
jgi:hypothetical protein